MSDDISNLPQADSPATVLPQVLDCLAKLQIGLVRNGYGYHYLGDHWPNCMTALTGPESKGSLAILPLRPELRFPKMEEYPNCVIIVGDKRIDSPEVKELGRTAKSFKNAMVYVNALTGKMCVYDGPITKPRLPHVRTDDLKRSLRMEIRDIPDALGRVHAAHAECQDTKIRKEIVTTGVRGEKMMVAAALFAIAFVIMRLLVVAMFTDAYSLESVQNGAAGWIQCGALTWDIVADGQWSRMLTYPFVSDPEIKERLFIYDMLIAGAVLFMFARFLENIQGRWRALVIMLACTFGIGVPAAAIFRDAVIAGPFVVIAGLVGAVFGTAFRNFGVFRFFLKGNFLTCIGGVACFALNMGIDISMVSLQFWPMMFGVPVGFLIAALASRKWTLAELEERRSKAIVVKKNIEKRCR